MYFTTLFNFDYAPYQGICNSLAPMSSDGKSDVTTPLAHPPGTPHGGAYFCHHASLGESHQETVADRSGNALHVYDGPNGTVWVKEGGLWSEREPIYTPMTPEVAIQHARMMAGHSNGEQQPVRGANEADFTSDESCPPPYSALGAIATCRDPESLDILSDASFLRSNLIDAYEGAMPPDYCSYDPSLYPTALDTPTRFGRMISRMSLLQPLLDATELSARLTASMNNSRYD